MPTPGQGGFWHLRRHYPSSIGNYGADAYDCQSFCAEDNHPISRHVKRTPPAEDITCMKFYRGSQFSKWRADHWTAKDEQDSIAIRHAILQHLFSFLMGALQKQKPLSAQPGMDQAGSLSHATVPLLPKTSRFGVLLNQSKWISLNVFPLYCVIYRPINAVASIQANL